MSFVNNKKIYIIGPVGSGKSSFSRKLSLKLKIKYYELDNIVWNDNKVKRSSKEIDILFRNILRKKSYIIEDVGRDIFKEGIVQADVVYYIKLSRLKSYYRIIKRWIRQRVKLEDANYDVNFKMLFKMIKWLHNDLVNQKAKIESIYRINSNLVIINSIKIKEIIDSIDMDSTNS